LPRRVGSLVDPGAKAKTKMRGSPPREPRRDCAGATAHL